MTNEQQVKREELFQEAMERSPQIIKGRKIIINMCVIFLISRVILLIADIVFTLTEGLPIIFCTMNFASTGFALFFAICIYKGANEFAYLPILGGAWSIINLYWGSLPLFINHNIYKYFVIIIVVISLVQIICMLFILLNNSCKYYFYEILNINKLTDRKGIFDSTAKKIFAGLIVICVFVLINLFVTVDAKPESPAVLHKNDNRYTITSGEIYEDEGGNFTIQYPEGWHVKEYNGVVDVINGQKNEFATLSIHKQPLAYISIPPKKAYEKELQYIYSKEKKVKVNKRSFVTLGDIGAIRIYITSYSVAGAINGPRMSELKYMFYAGQYTYEVSCKSFENDIKSYENTFEEIVKTFEVLK